MFKKWTWLLGLFISLTTAQAVCQNTQLQGKMVDPSGTGFTGFLRLTLAQQGAAIAPSCASSGAPSAVLPGIPIVIKLQNGAMATAPKVWGADCLNPNGIPYNVNVQDSFGNTLLNDQWLVAGATFDIGTAVSVLSPNVNYVPVPGPAGPSCPTTGPCIINMNGIINVQAAPYNAYCDAIESGAGLSITAGSPVTGAGITFASTDVGKVFTAGWNQSGVAYAMNGTILSVSGGNATLSVNAPVTGTIPAAHIHYGHDDQAAIQAALEAGRTNKDAVQLPTGSCLTSTLIYKGQTVFGSSKQLTKLYGMPGQDVFRSPDTGDSGYVATDYSPWYIHDLFIGVDTSVDASATAAGGNNTFPYRIAGTAEGLTPMAIPSAPGGLTLNNVCQGSITSGLTTLTITGGACGNQALTGTPPSWVVGQPVQLSNAGAGGTVFNSTVAAVVNNTTLTLVDPAGATTTNATGYIGTPATVVTKPPWYIGNCGVAFPAFDATKANGFNYGLMLNMQFGTINRAFSTENHSCAMFLQAGLYDNVFENIDIRYFWGGLIEAAPYSNNASTFAWTPDTVQFRHFTLYQNTIPLVTVNGNHRVWDGINIYQIGANFSLGTEFLGIPLGSSHTNAPSVSVSRIYDETNYWNGGEIQRWMGNGNSIDSGGLATGGSAGYVQWSGNLGMINAGIGTSLYISGYLNTFTDAGIPPWTAWPPSLTTPIIQDTGWSNRVYGGYNSAASTARTRDYNTDLIPTPPPLFGLDGSSFVAGISGNPVFSMNDQVNSCNDYPIMMSTFGVSCINDPLGTELTRTYMQKTGGGNGGFGTSGVAHNYENNRAGIRYPMVPVYAITQGQCEGTTSCTGTLQIADMTNAFSKNCTVSYNGTSGTYTPGATAGAWTTDGGPNSAHPCIVNLNLVTYGDVIGWTWGTTPFTGTPNPTAMDLAHITFMPVNTDVIQEVLASSGLANSLNGNIQALTSGSPSPINAKNWAWNGNPGIVDASSPVGFSTVTGNAGSISSVNGSTNFNAGPTGMVQAAPSIMTSAVQSTTTLTNTLSAAQTAVATTVTVNTPTVAAYPSSGCFFIDQELECWTGALTVGSTSITVTRGVWGTVAQAHAINAPAPVAPHGRVRATCNGATVADDLVIFLNTWTYYSAYAPFQNCSGFPVTFQIVSLADVPTGQTVKIASISIAQLGNSTNSPPSISGTVPTVNGGVCWKSTTQLGTCTAGTWPNCTTCN